MIHQHTSLPRILFLHGSSDLYGASRVLLQTIIASKKKGYHAEMVLTEKGPLYDKLIELDIPVHLIRMGVLRRKYNTLGGMMNRTFYMIKALVSLQKIIKNNRINIIYSNTSAVLVGVFASKLLGIKHIWHVHEIIERPKFLISILSYLMARFSDVNVVVSSATHDHWNSINPTLSVKNKLKTIFNGLDPSPYLTLSATPKPALSVGMIGRVHFWKGQSYFIDIANELVKLDPSMNFFMAGDAFKGYEYLLDEIAQQKIALGIDDKITDLGYVSNNPDFFSKIDLLILPSILPDPLPTVVLEAMASGIPVAATKMGGATDMIVEHVTGIFIPTDDAQEAARQIHDLMMNKARMKSMAEKGRERVLQHFSIDRYHQQIIELIQSMR